VNAGRPDAARASAPTGLWLEWERAESRSRRVLDKPLIIGRDPSSSIRLDDPTVSRRHAVVSIAAGQVLVDAAGSTNGIVVDGARVEKVSLVPGQSFRIGDATFRVVLAPVPRQTSAAAASPPKAANTAYGLAGAAPPPRPIPPASFMPSSPTRTAGPMIAIIVVAVVAMGSVASLAILHPFGPATSSSPTSAAGQPSAETAQGVWTVATGAIPTDAAPGLANAIESFAPPAPVFGSGFLVDSVRSKGDWAIAFGHAVAGPSDVNAPTETIVVIAHLADAGWQTVSNRDDGFCQSLNQLPQDLMDTAERSFYGCS
jgi:hypothetical protein